MPKRSYQSVQRAVSAENTRRSILDAALFLFEERGYPQTTMAEIAARAHVSMNAIYSGIGGKPHLLVALIAEIVQESQTVWSVTDIESVLSGPTLLRRIASGARSILERHEWMLGQLFENVATEPLIASAAAQGDSLLKSNLAAAAERLARLGVLQTDLMTARAADVMWFYFGFSLWRELRAAGWNWQESEDWLVKQAGLALLKESQTTTMEKTSQAMFSESESSHN